MPTNFKNMGRKLFLAFLHKENRKRFTEVLPPMTELILLHTDVVLHFPHHIKMA